METIQDEDNTIDINESEELSIINGIIGENIFKLGILPGDTILNICPDGNELILDYINGIQKIEKKISETNEERKWQPYNIKYTVVSVEEDIILNLQKINQKNNLIKHIDTIVSTPQNFLDENLEKYEWVILSGLFDKNTYTDKQFHFIDSILRKCLSITNEGVIFTYDSSISNDENYTISHILAYIHNVFPVWTAVRLNEYNYLFCINNYYHSVIS